MKILDLINLLPEDKRKPYLDRWNLAITREKSKGDIEAELSEIETNTQSLSAQILKDAEKELIDLAVEGKEKVKALEEVVGQDIASVEKRINEVLTKVEAKISEIENSHKKANGKLAEADKKISTECKERALAVARRITSIDRKMSSKFASTTEEILGKFPKEVEVVAGENIEVERKETKGKIKYKVSTDAITGVHVMNAPGGGGGAGEANTASSIGISGIGVYDSKVGSDLRFRKLSSLSPELRVTLGTSGTVDFGVTNLISNAVGTGGASVTINGVTITIHSTVGAGGTIENTDELPEGSSNFYYTETRFDSSLAGKDTNNLSEGVSNFYYTEGRFDTSLGTKNTNDLTEGSSGLYYSSVRFDSSFGGKDTNDLSEGVSNFYYTEGRFNTSFGNKSSNDLLEGASALYYSQQRFNTAFGAKDSDSLSEGSSNFYYRVSRLVGGIGITVYNTGITAQISAVNSEIDHNALSNYATNRHYLQSGITEVGTLSSLAVTGAISAGGDVNASTNGSDTANPRVFGYKDLSSGEACRFQFGDKHNGFQNSYGNDVQIFSYWGIQLAGGMQNYNAGFEPPAFSKTTNTGVLVVSTNDIGDDPGAGAIPITTFGVLGVTNQTSYMMRQYKADGTVLNQWGASGFLDMASHRIWNVVDPVNDQDAATKKYVDDRNTDKLGIVLDGGGGAITTGIKGDMMIPFACTINEVTLLAGITGSIVVDVWKDTYANYPATDADSITGSSSPAISSGIKSQDSTLTGWTTSIAGGDTLRYNVDSCTDITRCTLILKVTKT